MMTEDASWPVRGRGFFSSIRLDAFVPAIVIGFVIFALIKPDSLPYIGLGWLETALVLLDATTLAVLVLFLLLGKIRLNPITASIICMWVLLFLSTVLGSQDYLQLLKTVGPATCTCLLTDYMMKRNPRLYLGSCARALAALYTINAITIIIYYPEGMYDTEWVIGDSYFMGFDNGMIYGLIPMCVYALCYSEHTVGRLLTPLSAYCMALTAFSFCYVNAATGMISMATLLLFLVIRARTGDNAFVKPEVLIALFFIATFLIVVFRVQTFFADAISDIFGKDATLSGRTYLWDYTMRLIAQQPFIGYGATTRSIMGANGIAYPHPHCLVLDMLYRGGVPMLVAFVFMLIFFTVAYRKSHKGLTRDIILIGAFALLVGEITGSTQFKPLFYGMFALMSYCDVISNSVSKDGKPQKAPGAFCALSQGSVDEV